MIERIEAQILTVSDEYTPVKCDKGTAYKVFAAIKRSITLEPGESKQVRLGFKLQLPPLTVAVLRSSYELESAMDLSTVPEYSTVDPTNKGEVVITLENRSMVDIVIKPKSFVAVMNLMSHMPSVLMQVVRFK